MPIPVTAKRQWNALKTLPVAPTVGQARNRWRGAKHTAWPNVPADQFKWMLE